MLLLTMACLAAVIFSSQIDLFERFHDFSRRHDSWELDEFATIFIVLSVGGLIISSWRYRQMRREYAKRVKAEQWMAHLALNDALTGLPNRRSFNQQLESALSGQDRRFGCVVMMIDLDRFKPVNDLHGHGVGDQLLQKIARRLGDVLCDHECVARIGGDEFAVVLKGVGDNEALDRLATRILKAQTGVDPKRVDFEITETALFDDTEESLSMLNALHNLGVTISLDDFGTGYSSLSLLRMFPFDKIKIDKSFVQKMESSEECAAIVRSVVGLAHSLGMRTTAEGVETAAQADALKAEGCLELQGYLFSRPKRPDDLVEDGILKRRERAAEDTSSAEPVPAGRDGALRRVV